MLSVFTMTAAVAGPTEFGAILSTDGVPPVVVVLLCLASIGWTFQDMKKPTVEHTVVTRVCERCGPEA